jgi:hypothetical protein
MLLNGLIVFPQPTFLYQLLLYWSLKLVCYWLKDEIPPKEPRYVLGLTPVLPAFSDRIIAIDVAIAQCCAKLHVPNPRSDRDAIIAASALVHGMTVVTRNVKDFEPMGVEILNPWKFQKNK